MRAALAFLTPFPGARVPTPKALRWFPVVGVVLGFVVGGLWWATAKAWPLPVAALLVVAADLGLTGMLHLDGLADSADGLLPHLGPERRLEVMREPTVGAFGIGAVVVVLLARFAVFATLRPAPLLVAALWCVSRTSMAAVVERVPYARARGGPAQRLPRLGPSGLRRRPGGRRRSRPGRGVGGTGRSGGRGRVGGGLRGRRGLRPAADRGVHRRRPRCGGDGGGDRRPGGGGRPVVTARHIRAPHMTARHMRAAG